MHQPRRKKATAHRYRCVQAFIAVLLAIASPALRAGSLESVSTSASSLQERVATGSAALARGDNAVAETAFREALALDPSSVPLRNNLALALARQDRIPEAVVLYEQALALQPGDAVTERNLGVAYFRGHQFAEARPFLERSAASTRTFQFFELAGLDLFALNLYPEAARYLEQARALQPNDLHTLNMLGQAYLRSKNYAAMTKVFTRIMAIQPNSAEAHVMLATAYDKLFREQEAIREFQAAEQVDPNYPGVHTGLGVIFWRTDELPLAKQEFSLALKQTPTDPVANCTMGRILRREGNLHEAIARFQAALAANNVYKDALRELGQSWVDLHDPEKAIPFLQRAVALDDNDAELHYILGTALHETGQPLEAKRERAKAAQLLAEQHMSKPPTSENIRD